MLHTQIEDDEVIERYVRNRLTPGERRAFEEHFFSCDECFERVQVMERFVAGVRDAAEVGTLAASQESAALPVAPRWLTWGLAFSTCAAVALAIAVGWLTLSELPRMRSGLNATAAQVQSQQQMIAQLQQGPRLPETPEANVPLVMLQAERGNERAEAVLPANAKRLVLWVDIEPRHYTSYRMEVFSPSDKLIATIDHLTRSSYGALAVSLPTDQLQSGVFRITLTGETPPPTSLVGEYRLQIRKP